jgi:hypothetical protein
MQLLLIAQSDTEPPEERQRVGFLARSYLFDPLWETEWTLRVLSFSYPTRSILRGAREEPCVLIRTRQVVGRTVRR